MYQVTDMNVCFLSRWCVSVQMCLPPPVPSPGPSPSSLAAPRPHAGMTRGTSLWSFWSLGKTTALLMSRNWRYSTFLNLNIFFFSLRTVRAFGMLHAKSFFPVQCLSNAADGVRLAARIVDTPCNEMNTDHFLDVSENTSLFGNFWLVTAVILMQPHSQTSFSVSGNPGCRNWTWNYSSDHSGRGTKTKRVRRYWDCWCSSYISINIIHIIGNHLSEKLTVCIIFFLVNSYVCWKILGVISCCFYVSICFLNNALKELPLYSLTLWS